MRIVFNGQRRDIQYAYARAYAYLQAHHIQLRGEGFPWEVVLSEPPDSGAPEPAAREHIEIYYPIQ